MYTAVLEGGETINGEGIPWHDLPKDLKIESMGVVVSAVLPDGSTVGVANDMFSGFDRYGFQMYRSRLISGEDTPGESGVQIICVDDDRVMLTDICLMTGARRTVWRPLSQLTYKAELLRQGTR